MAVKNIDSEDNFKSEVEDAQGLVLVDFWAPWCGPCKMFSPVYDAMSEDDDYKTVKFTKVNVDEVEELGAAHKVMSIPTLMLFKDGEKIAEKAGAMNKDQLKEFIDSNK